MFHVNVKHWRNLVTKMSCFVCMKLKKGETCISGIVTVRKQDTERVVFLMFLCALLCLSFVLCRAGNRPPSIYIEPASKDIYFKRGETVKIECVANGTPEPRYIWKRNAEVFNPSGQDARVVQLPNQGTLVFNNPEPKDEGIFQCFADNGYGVSASLKVNFKEGTLKKFAYEPKRTHTVQAGNYLTLPCTPPQSIPTADVYWVYRSADGRWEAINFNKRITMDFEGKLRITNARKVDEAGGRTYCCMVSNYFMRVNAVGPEHQVKVIGVTEYKRPAHELWTSPSDQFFLKGETLKLKCIFAGSPTPEVYWERIGGSFPDRAAFRSFGQELQIKDLEFSDAGQYQCMGLNSQSTQRATKAFNVRIEAKPYWVNKPSDIEASVGGTATFICRAEGVPTPDYKWYINGVLLEDRQNKVGVRDPRIYNNLRFFKPNKNNITLVNLTLDDHMNVQCNASNNHGYVFSDVYLSVLAEKPVIIKLPPAQKKVTEGQAVMLDCLVTGKPDPVVTWYRGYSRITGGRFQIMSNGNLYIRKVIMSDAGDYHCQAQNTYGNVTSPSCKTTIIRRTRIKEHPGDLEVIEGDEAKFTCSGSTDFDEAKNMLVYWEKDDKILYSSQQRITQNIHDNSLTISATITRDSGVYTCVVTNGLDEDRAYAILTVKGRPDPPSSVVIERCRDDSATVKWVKGIENNTPVQYFIIQYNTSFYPDQWVSAKSVDYTQSIATVDLKPWGNYTFRVIAANKIGSSSPSLHTQQVCSTKPGRPDKNPRNLRSLGDQRHLLKLQWTPMNEMEHHGPGFRYLLTVRERGGTKSDTFSINNWRDNVIEIPSNKSAYSPYLVKLQAKNNIGDAREEVIENVIYSFEDIPTVRPYDVKVLYLGDRFANISWKWDRAWLDNDGKTNKICGEIKGFKIQYWRTSDKLTSFSEANVFMEHIIPTDSSLKVQNIVSEFRLSNLYPYSSMQVQVRVMNNYYVGPASDVDSFTTLEGVSGPVTQFQVLSRSSNSVFLTWQKPSEEDCNGVLLGYELGFQTVDGITLGVMQDQILQVSNPDTEKTLIGGLLPARKYRFHIYPLTRRGKGEGTFVEVTTTSESMQSSPVFEIDHITSYTINVTWASESSITEHSVHYVEFRKKGAAAWQKSMDEVLRNYTLLSALEAGTNYEIRVVAFNGYSRFYSKIKVVRTEGFVTPRALAANYGWFVVMLTSEVFMVSATVIIFMLYRHRRNVRESPRYKRGIVIMDAVTTRRFFHHQDSFARKPLIKNYTQTKIDSKHRRRGHRRRKYRGRLYESVRLQNECDNGSVSNDQSDSYEDARKLSKESSYYYASDSEKDTYNDYNDYCITDKDSIREKQDKNSYAVECNSTNESDTNESYELENYSDLSLEYSYKKTDTDDDSNNDNVDQIFDIYTDIKDTKSNNGINHNIEEKPLSDEEDSNESDEESSNESDEEYGDESDDEIDNDDEDSDEEHGYEEEDDADDETSSFDENVLCAGTQPDRVVVEYKSTCTNNNNKNSYTHKRQKH